MMKNASYFILKVSLVLKKLIFLSSLWPCEKKQIYEKDKVSFIIYDVTI